MINSITEFIEKGIHNLEKLGEDFAQHPEKLAEYILGVGRETNRLALNLIGETLTSRNTMICESQERKEKWRIIRTDSKKLITSLGTVSYKKTYFQHKERKEKSYLLDRIIPLSSHQRITEDAEARMLKEAVETSYRKGGEETCANEEWVSKQTVKNVLHSLEFPEVEAPKEKKVVDYLYIDADEDHIALQFKEKKGDLSVTDRGYKDNGILGKLVYVYEGIEKEAPESKRRRLKGVHYFSGVYEGEKNAALWKEVEDYLEKTYDLAQVKAIYLNADGGGWIQGFQSRFPEVIKVLDGFHMSKYLLKMSGHMLDSAGEVQAELKRRIREENPETFKAYVEEIAGYAETDRARERIRESGQYIINNWEAAKTRLSKRETVIGCSAEGHVSHVLSDRMSSRPMGWSRTGADKMCHLRAYWLNGGDFLELVRYQGKELAKAAGSEEAGCLSSAQVLASEKNRHGQVGKYIESMRASISVSTREKMFFRNHIMI